MKKSLRVFGLAVLGTLALAGAANAQISANGPYYPLPSWDQQLPTSSRFVVLKNWGGAAVLDLETGLVWQQSPATYTNLWDGALLACQESSTGGRFGWRLPALEELLTLVDPTTFNLYAGAPFTLGTSPQFWTATTHVVSTSNAWTVLVGTGLFSEPKEETSAYRSWCVRGYQGTQSPQ